jgi:hypothetical protein
VLTLLLKIARGMCVRCRKVGRPCEQLPMWVRILGLGAVGRVALFSEFMRWSGGSRLLGWAGVLVGLWLAAASAWAKPPPPKSKAAKPAPAAEARPSAAPDPANDAAPKAAGTQSKDVDKDPKAAKVTAVEESAKDKGVKTYKFSAIEVEGRLKSPQIVYFLRRVRAEFEAGDLGHRSFLPELSDTRRSPSLK